MSQHYSDPDRESDPHALPDIETFHFDGCDPSDPIMAGHVEPGWYWWACFPGCIPDSDPHGPFETEALALADARVE